MRLDLTVTHIPDIKSKQPWPRLSWFGKQTNDLLLLDSRRLKVLCLNGKNATKKKIAKLQSHLANLVATNISPDGTFLVCLLESGNLLVYQKDNDVLKTIPGIDQIATNWESSSSNAKEKATSGSPPALVFMSSSANHILVVIGHKQLFLWEVDQSVILSSTKQHILKGSWSRIDCEGATLPNPDCKEISVHALFFTDSVLGFSCICSFVFNHRSTIHISSVFLHWLESYHIYTSSQPRFTAQWSTLSVPFSDLSESAEPIRHRGAFLSHHAQSGHTLAVAVNQRSPVDTRVLFISIVGSTAVSVDMKGCGCRKDNIRTEKTRSYWVADMAWTTDDLFLACVTKQGCLTVLSRLGEAVLIQSSGCSVELEPNFYLPFHPLVTFVPMGKQRRFSLPSSSYSESVSPTSSIRSEADEKRQRYSLATHPNLPLLLLSDGYLATIIKLPSDLSCTGVIRDFLSEGRTAVNLLLEKQGLRGRRLRSLSTLQQQGALSKMKDSSQNWTGSQMLNTTADGLLSSVGSDFADYAGRFSHVEQGRFEYSDPTAMNRSGITLLDDVDRVPVIANRGQRALMSAWGLAVSHAGEWTYEMDNLIQYTAKTLVKLFTVMLRAIRPGRRQHERDQQYVSVIYSVLNLFKGSARVLHWDISHRHCLPTAFKLIKDTVSAILKHSGRHRLVLAPRCCVGILQHCEKLLTNIYILVAVHQPTACGFRPYAYHCADVVEGALMCQDCNRIRGTMDRDDHVMSPVLVHEEISRRHDWTDRQEIEQRVVVARQSPAKRLVKTWKLLHRHLVTMYKKLVMDSSIHHSRGVRRLLLLLCGVQMKLRQLGCRVSTSLSNEQTNHIGAGFLGGCQFYLQGYLEEAVASWQQTAYQTEDHRVSLNHGSRFSCSGSSNLLTSSLLAIMYTHLEQYNLVSALSLVDLLIGCYGVRTKDNGKGQRIEELGKYSRLTKSAASFLGWKRDGNKAGALPQLPCIPNPDQREVVQSLARFMALYFTNHPLFVFPPCAPKPLPPLHQKSQKDLTSRTVPVFHDRIAASVRRQQLSDLWTADTAMALLLVCGLLPEAVWLARELGDWKSALMLSVIASQQQMEYEKALDKAASCPELLLPENLTPLVIVKEGISVILQTPLTPPSSPEGGNSVKRNSSFNEQDRRRGSHSLSISTGMRRSASMCSINEEDRIMQEQLSRSLTDMLTAATVADLDPTPWLLSNLMDRCLSLVAEFNTLVPEEFYLPAPPFYCPQPDYEPKDSDPEEVLFESSLRREVNDVIQLIMLVLSSARCSLPCSRWYVQQLDLLLTIEARKKKTSALPLPSVLVDHARFPLDLLNTGIDSQNLPHCTVELLRVFRDLCSTVWMLHARDKLTLAVRKYQASRERSLRVKPHNTADIAKHSELLDDVLMWADNLYPFSSFLNLEEEVQDILLTAISELPPTKKTVAVLARHFHENTKNFSPLLLEKFNRLAEKLKRKRVVSARKMSKKNSDKENKRFVKYDTLYRHYRYQCKLRKLAVSNRLEEFGKSELQVFEDLTEKEEQNEKESKQNDTGGTLRSTETPASQTKTPNFSKQEASQYPQVGSREFESNSGYLDFLETFFLVAFGKIMQDSAPFSSKPQLPLIKAYSSELRQKEFGSIARRVSGQAKFTTVELNSSNFEFQILNQGDQVENTAEGSSEWIKSKLKEENQKSIMKSRGMFHQKPHRAEDVPLVISLKKYGSRSSLNSYADGSKDKASQVATPQKSKGEPASSKQGFLQPYLIITLNMSEVYENKAQLLQWFGRWAERQLAVYAQTSDQAVFESKAVLRVRLPQQLVLNSLWLIRHVYHADEFKTQTAARILDPSKPESIESSSMKRVKRRHKRKRDRVGDEHQSEKLRKSRGQQSTVTQYGDTDSQNDASDQEDRKPEKVTSKKKVQAEHLRNNREHREKDDLSDAKRRKKRKLSIVTRAHQSTSPSNLSANKEALNLLLMKVANAHAGRRTKPTKAFLNGSNSEEDFSRGTASVDVVSSQHGSDSGEDRDMSENPRNGLGTGASGLSQSSSRAKGGILVDDIFYYSDSDSNSTLDVSSLDEERPSKQDNWLLDLDKSFPSTPEVDNSDMIQLQSTSKEKPTSLNLNMKDADVKRLVREEFMRIMMEKSKTNSHGPPNSSLPKKAPPSDTLGLPSNSSKEMHCIAAQSSPHQQTLKPEPHGRPEVSETWAQVSLKGGIDVETQAPSPLTRETNMQTSSLKEASPSALHEADGRDVKMTGPGAGLTRQTEPAVTGSNRFGSEGSSGDVQWSEVDGAGQNGFKSNIHVTSRDADSHMDQSRMGEVIEVNEAEERTILREDDGEPDMSPLTLQDLDRGDKHNKNANGHHGVTQQELKTKMGLPGSQHEHQYERLDQEMSNFPLLHPQSALGFAMQVPVLLTVPPERLAQGTFGTTRTGFPPPPQRRVPSQSFEPQLINRQVSPDSGAVRTHLDMYKGTPSSNVGLGRPELIPFPPRNTQGAPHSGLVRYPPVTPQAASNYPISHLISLLHPGVKQPQQYANHDDLPPIPLLHLHPRHPTPIIPPSRPHFIPTSNPNHPHAGPRTDPQTNPGNPLPLLKFRDESKPPLFVPLDELDAFERGQQRQEREKHPAVRAREHLEQMEGKEDNHCPEMPAPIPLLHAELPNDLSNPTRRKRRQEHDKKGPTTDNRLKSADASKEGPQSVSLGKDQKMQLKDESTSVKESARKSEEVKTNVLVDSSKDSATAESILEKHKVSSSAEHSQSSDEGVEESTEHRDNKRKTDDLGRGFTIKPGSFDTLLQDRDARPAVPTPAQVHYDTVQRLQTKHNPSDNSSGIKETKNVGTTMGKDDFPHHKPTVSEAVAQYTAAATGVAPSGQIVAPDIFFNLRFGSSTSGQPASLQDKRIGKDTAKGTKGRSFISVVDVDLMDVPSPTGTPLPENSKEAVNRLEEPTAPPPTNAQLHYSAMFHKDAHPKKTPPKVMFETSDKETGGEGGPDAVTVKLLETKTQESSRQIQQIRARSESARQSTKDKLNDRLAQMDQQLIAIEESAANIEQDFRDTSLMLHTVENLTEAMATTGIRSKADYSLRDFREPDRTAVDHISTSGLEVLTLDTEKSPGATSVGEQLKKSGGLDGMVTMTTDEEDRTGIDRGDDTGLTLGISGISGVSDIIAEVIAEGDDSEVRRMGVSTRQQQAAKKKVEQRAVVKKLPIENLGRLSSDKIRELLETPRTPRPEESLERWTSGKKPTERSEQERKALQNWMIKQHAQTQAEYRKQREELLEKEHAPFRPKAGSETGHSSFKEMRKQELERDKKKKEMEEASHEERVQLAKALMAEIFTEKPRLSHSEAALSSSTSRREKVSRDLEVDSRRLDTSGLSVRPERRPASSRTQRGTLDGLSESRAIKARPGSAVNLGWVATKAEVGYNQGRELEKLKGSWFGASYLKSQDSREQGSQNKGDYSEQGTMNSKKDRKNLGDSIIGGDRERNEKTELRKTYKPKPFDQVVRVQRPEVTRKQSESVRTQKTYTEMLQEMQGETNQRRTASQSRKSKQRLFGTTRIPGSSRAPDPATPRVTKTYSERLTEMQQKSGSQTRLIPRTRPRGVPRINTATLTFTDGAYRRQEVERRGLYAEPTPRSSTLYRDSLAIPSLTGTHRMRDDVVSPTPKVGVKYRPKDGGTMTYVERLQRASLEAPRSSRHKTVYVGPTPRETFKSPPLRVPTTRHRPYPSQSQRSPDELGERSGFSDLSSWNVSDEVQKILQRRDSLEGDSAGGTDDDISIEGLEYDDYTASVNVKELEDIASISSGSVLSNIDWGAVDKMIADV